MNLLKRGLLLSVEVGVVQWGGFDGGITVGAALVLGRKVARVCKLGQGCQVYNLI